MWVSFLPLILMLVFLMIIVYIIKMRTKYKSETEKEAVRKGFIAYVLTNSPIIGWIVYKRNNPNDHL